MMAPMPTPVPPRGEETRAALISAALALYGDKGYEATSTREIAAAAKVNSAMIAYHFGGKEGVYSALVDRALALDRRYSDEGFAAGKQAKVPLLAG